LSLYPNPIAGGQSAQIYLGNAAVPYDKSVEVKLFSIEGKLVFSKTAFNGQMEVDVSALTAGVYMLRLQTAEGTVYNQKVILTR
jgi:hypothetical protein